MDTQPDPSRVTLPPELYRVITQYLHPHKDIRTLLSLSKASLTLRHEAQHILFRMGPEISLRRFRRRPQRYFEALCQRHESFLQSILSTRNRLLAGYVRRYDHFFTIKRPRTISTSTVPMSQLAGLLIQALPLMYNLKSLKIPLIELSGYEQELSRISSFQLNSLSIRPIPSTSASLTRLLQSQRALRHLHVDDMPISSPHQDAFNLSADMLPHLTSLQTGDLALWTRLAHTHDITAMILQTRDFLREEHEAALSKVKYLRICDAFDSIGSLKRIADSVELMIEVLRFDSIILMNERIERLAARLMHLRVLIVWDSNASMRVDGTIQSSLFFKRPAKIAFSLCKSLRYVVTPDHKRANGAYLYQRSADVIRDGRRHIEYIRYRLHLTDDVHPLSEELWWVKWAGILSGTSKLALRYGSPPQ